MHMLLPFEKMALKKSAEIKNAPFSERGVEN